MLILCYSNFMVRTKYLSRLRRLFVQNSLERIRSSGKRRVCVFTLRPNIYEFNVISSSSFLLLLIQIVSLFHMHNRWHRIKFTAINRNQALSDTFDWINSISSVAFFLFLSFCRSYPLSLSLRLF